MIRTSSLPSRWFHCLHSTCICIGSALAAPDSCALAVTSSSSPQRSKTRLEVAFEQAYFGNRNCNAGTEALTHALCFSTASRPNPPVVSYETRMPHAALQPYRHQRIVCAVDHPSSVSARLEHGAGAVRSSQPALAAPRTSTTTFRHAGTALWNRPPRGRG